MVDQAEKCEPFFDRVQIFAHDILDQRHLERRTIIKLANYDWNRLETRRTRRPQPPLSRDQLVARAVGVGRGDSPHDQRFDNSLALDRARKLGQPLLVEIYPRLKPAGRDTAGGRQLELRIAATLDSRANFSSRRRIADQRIEPAPQW